MSNDAIACEFGAFDVAVIGSQPVITQNDKVGQIDVAVAWEEVATAVISEATLVEQPRGKELEYRVIAVNKSGDGEPSNTVMVVL